MEVLLLLLFCIFLIVAVLIMLCKCDRRRSEYRYSSRNMRTAATTVTIEEIVPYPDNQNNFKALSSTLPMPTSQYIPLQTSPEELGNPAERFSSESYSPESNYSSVRQYPSHKRSPYPTDPEMSETPTNDQPPSYSEIVQERSGTSQIFSKK